MCNINICTALSQQELLGKGIRISKHRYIECYLFYDEIISKLCETTGKPELVGECLGAKKQAV